MSKVSLEKLNDVQFDVLKEIGNIGAGNATTALSTMHNVKMDMSVPNVALIQFKDISTIIGSEDPDGSRYFVRTWWRYRRNDDVYIRYQISTPSC